MSKKPVIPPTRTGRLLGAIASALILFLIFVGGCVLPPALAGYAGYLILGDGRGIRIGIVLGIMFSVVLAMNGFELPFGRKRQGTPQGRGKAVRKREDKEPPE